jgi:hypothetical protein
MKRRSFLAGATIGGAFAAAQSALPQSSAPARQYAGDGRLKLLFMDRQDVWNTWGQIRFGATPTERIADPPQKEFIVKCCLQREGGGYDVWGFHGADKKPWKLIRCVTHDGIHFEDVRTVLERTEGGQWAHTCSVNYSPELGRWVFLKNMNTVDGFSIFAFTSTDGDHWQEYEHNPVFEEGDRWGALWSPAAQRFVYFGKGIQRCEKRIPELFANARRVVTLRSSPDGFRWTPDSPSFYRRSENYAKGAAFGRQVNGPLVPAEFQISPDEQDPPELEFYAGDGFHYGDRYYLLVLNYAASAIPPGIPPVNANGHGPALDTEWWISRDGLHWDRPFRDVRAGEMFLHHNPMIVDGKLLFHTEDGLWAIPEDRITYVTARANAVFESLQFTSPGRPFHLNARIPGSAYRSYREQAYVMAELIDDADRVFPGYSKEHCILQPPRDAQDLPLRWEGRDGTELKDKRMRIRFYLRAADIFAVRS